MLNVPSLIVTILLHRGATGANHVGQRYDTGSRHETSPRRARAMKPPDEATARRFLTVAEVAEYFNVGRNTIYRLARNGKIPAFKIGDDWRFDKGAIEKLVTDRTGEVVNKERRGGSR